MTEQDFYKNLPVLETKRLILRPFFLNNVNDYFNFASDPEVTKYLHWNPHHDREYAHR